MQALRFPLGFDIEAPDAGGDELAEPNRRADLVYCFCDYTSPNSCSLENSRLNPAPIPPSLRSAYLFKYDMHLL